MNATNGREQRLRARIDDLTDQRDDARREAEYYRNRYDRMEKPGRWKYMTEAERVAARRETWREASRRRYEKERKGD